MKKLPKLPEYPTLDEVAAWLTEASDEAWSPSAVLSRLLECERPEVLSDGTVRPPRVATSREVWVVVPPGEAMTAQVDGAEVVTRWGLLAYILEPIDLFVSTVWHCGEAVALNGVSTQAGERFHVTRSFSVRDIRIPRNDAFQLLSAFDQLVLELDRGEHSDLARLVDDRAHGSIVSPTISHQSAGEQEGQEYMGYLPAPITSRVLTEQPARTEAELMPSGELMPGKLPPGKLPRVAIGRLTVKAAWEIELETGRFAKVKEVMERLQFWADTGNEPGYLISSNRKKSVCSGEQRPARKNATTKRRAVRPLNVGLGADRSKTVETQARQ